MRSSRGGWVEKSRISVWPLSGFTMKRCAVAGVASAIGIAWFAIWSFSRALASPQGRPATRAPVASAWNSRERETAICTSRAAIAQSAGSRRRRNR